MARLASLRSEFEHEAQTTRRLLERIPEGKLGWRPHEKSFSAGGLGSHLVDLVRWTPAIFDAEEFVFDASTYQHYEASSVHDLLATFDRDVAKALASLAAAKDGDEERIWRMKMRGRVRVEKSKEDAFRDFTLSHMIHHRGQLSVYLRLLDVPVPGAYGPTADEGL